MALCLPIQSRVRFTWRITSGPMPSPARIRSFLFAAMIFRSFEEDRDGSASSRPHPGPRLAVTRLEAVDGGRLLQRQADVVEPVQQAMLAEGIDVEADEPAVGAGDLLLLQIDG